MILLRPATAEDAADVAEIWCAGWRDGHLGGVPEELVTVRTPESFHKRARDRVRDTTVATVNGSVAGFVMVVADEVEQVYVGSEHRGRGVAQLLLSEAARQVAGNGFDEAWLAVVASNARARAFYARAGWLDRGLFEYQAATEIGPIKVPAHRYTKQVSDRVVKHRTIEIDGIRTFYREAGPKDAPAILLPHGYPCSSYEFRDLMPALADRWRLVAPDFPGFGYSDTPGFSSFGYDFDSYAGFLERLAAKLDLRKFAIYLHDYGSQIGLRLAIRRPGWIAALIIQNGDIYEDVLGPKYQGLKDYFNDPSPERRQKLIDAVSEEGFKDEFLNDIREELKERISPDLWKLHWPVMNTPERREISVRLMEGLKENLSWFPRYQAYLRENQPPTLIVWGPQDGYMPEPSARAYLRDLPAAELHLLDGGHWLLETNLGEVIALVRDFLGRVHAGEATGK